MCATDDCAARRKLARDALYRAAVGEAIIHVAKGAAEIVGLKEKAGSEELAEAVKENLTTEKPKPKRGMIELPKK